MLEGFKKFIMRGNVIDLAVAVIIAQAFAPIVDNLTNKVLMPLIGAIFGKPSFDAVGAFHVGKAEILPGTVLTAGINFLLIAAAIYFCLVMPMNKINERIAAKKDTEEKPEAPSEEVVLLTEIRDALAQR